jgi:hypothetical protein
LHGFRKSRPAKFIGILRIFFAKSGMTLLIVVSAWSGGYLGHAGGVAPASRHVHACAAALVSRLSALACKAGEKEIWARFR